MLPRAAQMVHGAYIANTLIICGGMSRTIANDKLSGLSTSYRKCYGRTNVSTNWQDHGNMPIVRISPSSAVLQARQLFLVIGEWHQGMPF